MSKTFNKTPGMSDSTYQSYIDRGYTPNTPSAPSSPSGGSTPSFNTGGGSFTAQNTYGGNGGNGGSSNKVSLVVNAAQNAKNNPNSRNNAKNTLSSIKNTLSKFNSASTGWSYTPSSGGGGSAGSSATAPKLTTGGGGKNMLINGVVMGGKNTIGDKNTLNNGVVIGGKNAKISTASGTKESPAYKKFKSKTLEEKAKQPGSGVTGGQLQGVTVNGKRKIVQGDPVKIAMIKETYALKTGDKIPINGTVDDDYFKAIDYLNSNGGVSQKTGAGNAKILPNSMTYGENEQYIADNPRSALGIAFAKDTALNMLTPASITVDQNDTVDSIHQKWMSAGGGSRHVGAFGLVTPQQFLEQAKASGVDIQNGVLGTINSPTHPMPGSPLWYAMKEIDPKFSFNDSTGADYNRLKFSGGEYTNNGIYGTQFPSYGAERVDGQWIGDPALAVANFAVPRSSGQMDENGLPISHSANPAADIAKDRISGMPGFGWEDVQRTIDDRLSRPVGGVKGAQIEVDNASIGEMGVGMPQSADMQMGGGQYGGGGGGGNYGFNDVSYSGIGENDAKSAAQGQVYPQLNSAISQLEQSTQQAIDAVRRDYEGRGLGQSDALLNRISQLTADMNEQKASMTQQAEYNVSVLAQQILAQSQSQKLQADMFNSQGGYNAYNDWRNAQMQGNRDTFEQWLAKQNLAMDKDGLQFEKDKLNQSQSQFDKELQYKYDTFNKSYSLDERKYLLDEQITKLEMEIKSGQWKLTQQKMLSAAAKRGSNASSIKKASSLGQVEVREALDIANNLVKNSNGDTMQAKRNVLSNAGFYNDRYQNQGFSDLIVGALDTIAEQAMINAPRG